MNNPIRLLLGSSLFFSMIVGCSAIPLRPGAERVIASKNPAPKSCKFLGHVVGTQGGAFSGDFTSNENLSTGAMNDLRNKAFDLRGNYVQIETDRAGVTGSGMSTGYSGSYSSAQTDVTMSGNVYSCDPAEIGLQ